MDATRPVIDLGSEIIIDRSGIRDPYARLMATAVGETLAGGSPWVAIDKEVASRCFLIHRSAAHATGRPRHLSTACA